LCSAFPIGIRNLLRLPVVHGATKPAEGHRHGSRRNRLVVFALVVESFGYGALSGVVIVGALAIGVYVI
jgi:hypothetical protein